MASIVCQRGGSSSTKIRLQASTALEGIAESQAKAHRTLSRGHSGSGGPAGVGVGEVGEGGVHAPTCWAHGVVRIKV